MVNSRFHKESDPRTRCMHASGCGAASDKGETTTAGRQCTERKEQAQPRNSQVPRRALNGERESHSTDRYDFMLCRISSGSRTVSTDAVQRATAEVQAVASAADGAHRPPPGLTDNLDPGIRCRLCRISPGRTRANGATGHLGGDWGSGEVQRRSPAKGRDSKNRQNKPAGKHVGRLTRWQENAELMKAALLRSSFGGTCTAHGGQKVLPHQMAHQVSDRRCEAAMWLPSVPSSPVIQCVTEASLGCLMQSDDPGLSRNDMRQRPAWLRPACETRTQNPDSHRVPGCPRLSWGLR